METWLAEEKQFQDTFGAWNLTVEKYKHEHPGVPWDDVVAACGLVPWNPPAGPGSPYRPGGLAETMVREIIPVTVTAVLFYQGEEDTTKTDHYDELFTLLIRTWRTWFREEDLPFLFVQLPMWIDSGAADTFLWPNNGDTGLQMKNLAVRLRFSCSEDLLTATENLANG